MSQSAKASPAVEARELSRHFGRRWALARLNLSVPAGQRLLVMGANGSGKTTLLRLLSTVLSPSHGSLRLFGADPRSQPEEIRARLALLSHQTGLYEDLSARDNLGVLARLTRRSAASVKALLQRVGLEDRPEPVRAYSAGMRKRLQFAALLLQEPELVLIDEPFSALDPEGMRQVEGIIRELPGTVIVASHQLRRASAFCDRALLLERGLTRWEGPASYAWHAWCMVHPTSDEPGETPAGAAV